MSGVYCSQKFCYSYYTFHRVLHQFASLSYPLILCTCHAIGPWRRAKVKILATLKTLLIWSWLLICFKWSEHVTICLTIDTYNKTCEPSNSKRSRTYFNRLNKQETIIKEFINGTNNKFTKRIRELFNQLVMEAVLILVVLFAYLLFSVSKVAIVSVSNSFCN